MSKALLGKVLRDNGTKLVAKAVDSVVLTADATKGQQRISLPRKIAGAALLRVATKSVPGAIVVGGALLAKHLYDRKKARDAAARTEGTQAAPALTDQRKVD
ncbi:hypothetical protein GTZ99_01060 [Novosphingobium sp. FSY-8]|uniref:Uncharacterized protein n=1 Tax=Novosphingobium ovatum TaxID=1908523 RepID=A0ABW9X9F4_9SPHN|nr:hypothetical protein [Novosphingobium ovatum]NBC35143.1 hypothetical protein [Novosphingobium ovatum]